DHVLLFQFAGEGKELVVASTWTDPEVRHRFEDSGEAPTQGEPWHQLVLFSPAAEPPLEPVRDPGSRAGLDVRASLTVPLEAGGGPRRGHGTRGAGWARITSRPAGISRARRYRSRRSRSPVSRGCSMARLRASPSSTRAAIRSPTVGSRCPSCP